MNLGKRIEKAFDMAGLRAPDVARASGVPAATINAMMRRDSKRSDFTELILAQIPAHRVNVEWVRSGQGTPEPIQTAGAAPTPTPAQYQYKESPHAPRHMAAANFAAHTEAVGLTVSLKSWEHPQELPQGEWVFIPKLGVLYGAQGSSGIRTVQLQDEVQPFRTHWIRQGKHAPKGLAWHEAVDASMHPVICSGDNMVVDTAQVRPLQDGRVYAVWYGDALRPRRVQLLPNGGARLVPRNPEFLTIDLDAEQFAALHILGRVVHREGSGEL